MATTKIDEFEVMYSANAFVPRIWLKAGGAWIGQLVFEQNGKALPPDGQVGGQVNLYYHVDDFSNALDLMRNEAPIYLLFNGPGPGNENGLLTSLDLVDMGEKVRT